MVLVKIDFSPQKQRMKDVVNGTILYALWLVYYPSKETSTLFVTTDFVPQNVAVSETGSLLGKIGWQRICNTQS